MQTVNRSPGFLPRLPWLGEHSKDPSIAVINNIRGENFCETNESIKEAYTFIATNLHSGGVKNALTDVVNKLDDKENLKKLIDPLIELLIEKGDSYLKCLEMMPQDKIKLLLEGEATNIKDFMERAKAYAGHLPVEFSPNASTTSYALVTFFGNIMHLFQSTFRLDTEEQYISIFDTKSLLDIYLAYLTIPIIIASKLAEWFLNWQTVFLATIVVLVALGVANFIYNRYFKSAPRSLPRGINLNRALLNGRLSPTAENKGDLDQLNKMLVSSNKESAIHPFLVGSSGSGKTSLAVAYAQQQILLQQEKKEFKTVYIVKTADLVNSYVGMGDQIKQIAAMVKDHKNVVIFFEEFDTTMDKDEQLFKILFGLRDQQDVICIPVMTPKGLEKLKGEAEFFNRFAPLQVGGEATTEQAVRYFHNAYLGDIHVTEEAMKELAKCAQPSEAIGKLKRACLLVSHQEKLGTHAVLIKKKESELGILKAMLQYDSSLETENSKENKEKEIKELEEKYDPDIQRWKKVHLLSQRRFEFKCLVNRIARDLKNEVIPLAAQDMAVRRYAFLRYHLLPLLNQKLDQCVYDDTKFAEKTTIVRRFVHRPVENYIPSYVDVPLLSIEK